ncbi:hypothetical protein AMATHDRAFT_42604 [Amanita thiersii Skay4041]|uniref:Uncharacterized protein n=1 Tax=Amanita thiersii Skay4041 TaxID=703135 RepID=A0A2A9NCY8_9AGAR|nr:hypothetical protein AMATHDRAFT_42604 [Amanita thiersii Skay4041]
MVLARGCRDSCTIVSSDRHPILSLHRVSLHYSTMILLLEADSILSSLILKRAPTPPQYSKLIACIPEMSIIFMASLGIFSYWNTHGLQKYHFPLFLWLGYLASAAIFHHWPLKGIKPFSLLNPQQFYFISQNIYAFITSLCLYATLLVTPHYWDPKNAESIDKQTSPIRTVSTCALLYACISVVYGLSPIPKSKSTIMGIFWELLRPAITFPIAGVVFNYIIIHVKKKSAKSPDHSIGVEEKPILLTDHASQKLDSESNMN